MSQWTDEQLRELLHEAFVAREGQADPDVARRIARETGARRPKLWLVAVGAAAAVALVMAGVQLERSILDPAPQVHLGPPAGPVTPVPAGHNREVAEQAADRLLRDAPVPPGAVPRDAVSPRSLHKLGAYYDDVDPSLTRTAFWIVPMSHVDLVDWYAAHTPAERAETLTPDSNEPAPEAVMSWAVRRPTTAYTQPAMVVAYARLGPERTALRIDVTLAARYDRTAETLVPPTGLEAATITAHSLSGQATPRPVTITDPAELRALADRFDHASLAPTHSELHPCGSPVGDDQIYSVVFRWAGHVLEVTPGQPLCGIGRDLIFDGQLQRPKLGRDAQFDGLLAALARSE